jgi:3D (Asp-Asp-Asp) domain-containing protein
MSASAWVAVVSTAYCLTGTMADGSYTREASIAHNGFPLGTRVTVSPPFRGRRRFVVRDRIGWGTDLDFWAPSCGSAIQYGRRVIRVRRGWSHSVGRVRRIRAFLPMAMVRHRAGLATP